MTERMEGALSALKGAFPEALLVTAPIERGLKRPCIQLLLEEVSLKREMGRRWRRGEAVTAVWYPKEGGEVPREAAEKLLLLLGEAYPHAKLGAEREGDTFRVRAEWEQICFLSREEAEMMKRQILKIGQALEESPSGR